MESYSIVLLIIVAALILVPVIVAYAHVRQRLLERIFKNNFIGGL